MQEQVLLGFSLSLSLGQRPTEVWTYTSTLIVGHSYFHRARRKSTTLLGFLAPNRHSAAQPSIPICHEVVVARIEWSRLRGFQRVDIWSCKPENGTASFGRHDRMLTWRNPRRRNHHQNTRGSRLCDTVPASSTVRCYEMGATGTM